MSYWNESIPFDTLVGKTLGRITVAADGERISFITDDGEVYKQYHEQDCCENVTVEDIIGDLDDLISSPIIRASEDTSRMVNPDDYVPDGRGRDSFTWTFYNIATIKGHVTIRWYGSSNGYYSESVNFIKES